MYVPTYICDFCVWTHGSTHNNTTKYILSSFCRGEVESVVWTVCHWQSSSVAKSAFKVCLSNHKAHVLKQCILDVKLPESIWKSSEYGYILEMTPLGTANKIFWAESLEGTEIKDSFFFRGLRQGFCVPGLQGTYSDWRQGWVCVLGKVEEKRSGMKSTSPSEHNYMMSRVWLKKERGSGSQYIPLTRLT